MLTIDHALDHHFDRTRVHPDGQETVTAERASVIPLLVADDRRLVSALHLARRS